MLIHARPNSNRPRGSPQLTSLRSSAQYDDIEDITVSIPCTCWFCEMSAVLDPRRWLTFQRRREVMSAEGSPQ